MRDLYLNFGALMAAAWYAKKRRQQPPPGKNQVLQSRRMEDEVYRQNRPRSEALEEVRRTCEAKFPLIENLSRDIFQSLYSLNIRHNEQSELSLLARRFNRHILGEIMKSPDYPAMKSICEGRGYQSMESAAEFMEQVAENMDELLAAANGGNKALDALEAQERRAAQLLQDLKEQARERESNPSPELEKKLLKTANRLDSKERQVERLNQMVRDNLAKSKPAREILARAMEDAKEKAREVQSILRSWGDEAGGGEPSELDRALVEKVRQNQQLLEISEYLGRLKELIRQKRKNAYAYGRGEKYALELGNNLSRTLSSEMALLAAPETVPLFLRKLQRKGLKQYARREHISKGQGDIIVCLDESSSTIGPNAAWGKAIAFALLEIAEINRRDFALIHFSSGRQVKIDLFEHGRYPKERVFEAAQHFFGGGTDFETPLDQAVDLMKERGWSKADLVFITDGECRVSEKFAERFAQSKTAMGFTVTGVLMDQDEPGMAFSLKPFCDEIIRISEVGGDRAADLLIGDRA